MAIPCVWRNSTAACHTQATQRTMAIVQAANAHMFIYFSSTVHPRHGTGAQPKRRSQAEAALLVRIDRRREKLDGGRDAADDHLRRPHLPHRQ